MLFQGCLRNSEGFNGGWTLGSYGYKLEVMSGFDVSYQKIIVQDHFEMRHSARVLCNPRSGMVFTTINTHTEMSFISLE